MTDVCASDRERDLLRERGQGRLYVERGGRGRHEGWVMGITCRKARDQIDMLGRVIRGLKARSEQVNKRAYSNEV